MTKEQVEEFQISILDQILTISEEPLPDLETARQTVIEFCNQVSEELLNGEEARN